MTRVTVPRFGPKRDKSNDRLTPSPAGPAPRIVWWDRGSRVALHGPRARSSAGAGKHHPPFGVLLTGVFGRATAAVQSGKSGGVGANGVYCIGSRAIAPAPADDRRLKRNPKLQCTRSVRQIWRHFALLASSCYGPQRGAVCGGFRLT